MERTGKEAPLLSLHEGGLAPSADWGLMTYLVTATRPCGADVRLRLR